MIIIEKRKLVALFAALSAFLAVSESFIPVPVPFIRLGISNIPVCLGLSLFKIREIIFITAFKVVISHIFRGTLLSYPFIVSLSGNILFLLCIIPVFKLFHKHISFISISLIGAITHNCGQVAGAALFVPLQTTIFIVIIMLPVGIVTGIVNGLICNNVYKKYFTGIINGDVTIKE